MDEFEVRWLMARSAPDVDAVLAELMRRPAWHRRAACRGMGADQFVVARGQSTDPAKAVCASCEVTAECLAAAMASQETQGI